MPQLIKSEKNTEETRQLTCGLIMPISSIDGCGAEHWLEVKAIITEAISSITDYDFSVKLVSDQDDVGVIQKRIVQNIHDSDIVVCDVSCKNPNVMFELGMRLAFDKPTVVIKDDATDYSFDTSPLEHLNYPRDLRFSKINAFKQGLAEKVSATYKASLSKDWQSFLSSFGTFKVASIDHAVGTADQIVMESLQELFSEVSKLSRRLSLLDPKPVDAVVDLSSYSDFRFNGSVTKGGMVVANIRAMGYEASLITGDQAGEIMIRVQGPLSKETASRILNLIKRYGSNVASLE